MSPFPTIVGVDTGGTFTDVVAFVGGTLRTHKILSTPDNPARAVLQGLREICPETGPVLLTYGSTVATNALLERRGARILLLTTAGFEDLIEIGRQNRPDLYALEPRRPAPLVPPQRRIGVAERMAYDGQPLRPLRPAAVRDAMRAIRRHRPDAVAICLLHAYANPEHERLLGNAVAALGNLFCSLSHELVAEHREYERLSTTVINAYVGPVMSRHLGELTARLDPAVRLRVMQSNGGAISPECAAREAVRSALSGPAAGVRGASAVAATLGLRKIITFDMGGTSTDVSLIDGAVRYCTDWEIGGLPLKVPAIDIHTVGAGGGSLAHLDAGGALKVGPNSAGAEPGPACYGRGTGATVTDANVVLGRLVADAFLGGRLRLQPDRARAALAPIGRRLGRTAERAAAGVVQVINASMERAIRRISVERGHDPADFALIAFGGAAGQHACELAAALRIARVIVPRHPGLLSAWGASAADLQRDYVRTVQLTSPSAGHLRRIFAELERAAHADLGQEAVPKSRRVVRRTVDVRYVGQSYEINVPFDARFIAAFHAAHAKLYGYADPERSVEVVTLRAVAVGKHRRPPEPGFRASAGPRSARHRVHWNGRWTAARSYGRDTLPAGTTVRGPAVISEFSATTFVPPGWRATVHRTGHLVLTTNEA